MHVNLKTATNTIVKIHLGPVTLRSDDCMSKRPFATAEAPGGCAVSHAPVRDQER